VVKFLNNPQHRRILVNEMLGTSLASRLGLPTAPVNVVEVPEELIRLTTSPTCNTNGRQTVFFEPQSRNRGMGVGSGPGEGTESEGENKAHYHTATIDQGFCCNAAE
jgi:hypothetical protein